MPRQGNRFTIFDKMEQDGRFQINPANPDARDPVTGENLYAGPIEFPKMLYHPQGEERIIVPAELVSTLEGVKRVGEQREIIFRIVSNPAEEAQAKAEGWHNHPAHAIRARIEGQIARGEATEAALKAVPVMSSDQRIKELEAELVRLQASKAGDEPEPKAAAKAPKAAVTSAA